MLNSSYIISKLSWFCFDFELWKLALFGLFKCFLNSIICIGTLCIILVIFCGVDEEKIKIYKNMLQVPSFIIVESIFIIYIFEVISIIVSAGGV